MEPSLVYLYNLLLFHLVNNLVMLLVFDYFFRRVSCALIVGVLASNGGIAVLSYWLGSWVDLAHKPEFYLQTMGYTFSGVLLLIFWSIWFSKQVLKMVPFLLISVLGSAIITYWWFHAMVRYAMYVRMAQV